MIQHPPPVLDLSVGQPATWPRLFPLRQAVE
jgi:hypothetical protein